MKLKKLVAITLSAVMCMAALTGCGGKSDSAKKTAKVIEVDLTDEQYAFGVDKDQPDLLKEVNQFVKDMKSDGTFDEICNRYFGDGTPVPVKSAAYDESKDQLVVATNAAFEPFEYMDGENYVGIDMEIAKVIRLGFLQQNAFHKDDTCVSLEKQFKMMDVILYLYKTSRKLVAMGMPMSVLKAEGIFEKVIAIKYDVPNDNLQLLDLYKLDIDDFYNRVIEKNA